MKKILSVIFLCLFFVSGFLLINGCATIFGWQKPELVNIRSTPDEAKVVITDESGTKIYEGTTPANVTLKKKKGFFSGKSYNVTVKKDGFTDRTFSIDTQVNGWYIGGNIVFGGLIGWLIVDPATGAMWTFDQNDFDISLEPAESGALLNKNGVKVICLQDLPESLRNHLTPVTK